MASNLRSILRQFGPTRQFFLFDLDRTLWDYTVEFQQHIDPQEAVKYVPPERVLILKAIQDAGHYIGICSRSKEEQKCKQLLALAYPDIVFQSLQIYPTSEYKDTHVVRALGPGRHRFHFFDDEKYIMDHLKTLHPLARFYHTPNGLSEETFGNGY